MARKNRKNPGLLHYIDGRFASVEREISTRHELGEAEIDRRVGALKEAADTATAELKQRLEGMNEFRAALSDTVSRTVTREAFEAAIGTLSDRVDQRVDGNIARLDSIERALDRQRGRQLAYASIAAVATAILTIFILVAGHIQVH